MEVDLSSIEHAFSAARDEGVQNIAQIAAQHSSELGISQQQCEVYLRDHLYFYLGERERQGQELFRRYVDELAAVAQNG